MENVIKYYLEKKEDNYFFYAKNNGKQVGYLWFTLNKDEAFLHYIEVNEEARCKKIGSNLLKCLEKFCKENHKDHIEGKFYPVGISMEHALAFYKRNGYHHMYDDYDQIITKSFYISNRSTANVHYIDTRKEFITKVNGRIF